MIASGVINSMTKGYLGFLKANIPSLAQAFDEFPNPSQKLAFPAVSIVMKNAKFSPFDPYVIAKGTPGTGGKTPVTKVMGEWDISYQLDFWTDSKPARQAMFDAFMASMTKDNKVNGLSLQLSDYYNEWARFDVTDSKFMDSERQSQQSEWRLMIDVIANVKEIRQSVEYLVTTIENNLDTSGTPIPAPTAATGVIL